MIITTASASVRFPKHKDTILEMMMLVEEAARLCYQSEGPAKAVFNDAFIRSKIDAGHESVIEHSMISVRIICDRGVTHEIVRHRLASYSQESTRYCNYSKGKFGNQITVINPVVGFKYDLTKENNRLKFDEWIFAMEDAERHYLRMIELGARPQEARSVLPNSTKTEILMTMNFREWRHFFRLRTALAAHPQMQEITKPLLQELQQTFPVIFEDIIV